MITQLKRIQDEIERLRAVIRDSLERAAKARDRLEASQHRGRALAAEERIDTLRWELERMARSLGIELDRRTPMGAPASVSAVLAGPASQQSKGRATDGVAAASEDSVRQGTAALGKGAGVSWPAPERTNGFVEGSSDPAVSRETSSHGMTSPAPVGGGPGQGGLGGPGQVRGMAGSGERSELPPVAAWVPGNGTGCTAGAPICAARPRDRTATLSAGAPEPCVGAPGDGEGPAGSGQLGHSDAWTCAGNSTASHAPASLPEHCGPLLGIGIGQDRDAEAGLRHAAQRHSSAASGTGGAPPGRPTADVAEAMASPGQRCDATALVGGDSEPVASAPIRSPSGRDSRAVLEAGQRRGSSPSPTTVLRESSRGRPLTAAGTAGTEDGHHARSLDRTETPAGITRISVPRYSRQQLIRMLIRQAVEEDAR